MNTSTLAAEALAIAQGQVGQQEKPMGSNSGPMVDKYLRSVGTAPGYAWCQAFVYWCYESAAKKLGIANQVPKTAGVHDCWNRATSKVTKVTAQQQPGTISAGDQIILLFGKDSGHTGIVERIDGVELHTIEGNSNNNGSREGFEVVRHVRSLQDKWLAGFIKYQ